MFRRRNQAARRRTGFQFSLDTYLHIHLHTLFASLGRLCRHPFSLVMTVGVIGITLALPAGMQVTLMNLELASGRLELNHQISLFLKQDLTDTRARLLNERLQKNPAIEAATLISRDQALEEFQQYSGFGKALDALQNNPLPHVIQVAPKDTFANPTALTKLVDELQSDPEIDQIQMDMAWLKRLNAILGIAERGITLLTGLLGLAVLLIVGNTIRLELNNRREEIEITRLVGATAAFIRRPFVYCGFWYGLLGGLIACVLVNGALWMLHGPTSTLSQLYQSSFSLHFMSFSNLLFLIVFSVSLGIFGAWIVVHRHLHHLERQ